MQKKKPDTSSATVITGSGGNGGARLTSIQTTGGHARGGQKSRLNENNMAAAAEIQNSQEMNDIQVRVVKDSTNEGPGGAPSVGRNIGTIEVEASPASRAEALLTDAAANGGGANAQQPPVAQVTKALVNDHHVNNTESNGAAASTPAGSTSGVATSAGAGGSDGIEEVPQVKISNL